ncbi:hypothetical protein [Paracoccus sp. S-4012]|uniref:hypothetical protein n=1 Tax=Paracoccus sp. S-4012 TaxID=2665648 RepID=UPI001E2B02B0|nr:hypothetical protein [Paracoccus sp. S-4012]
MGSLFLQVANAVFFGSLLFGYAFLWTVAPNWPPPAYLEPETLAVALAAGGVIVAPIAVRFAQSRLRSGAMPYLGLALAAAALAALVAAGLLVLRGLPDPQAHAYAATVWVLAGYTMFHAVLAGTMTIFVMARAASGFLSVRRSGELRVVRFWTNYAALVTLLALAAVWLPGLLT